MSENYRYVADISDNNGGFNASAYASAGHVAIGIKAIEDGAIQPTYAPWVEAAREHKLSVIHYCFARPELGNPVQQATQFWAAIEKHLHRPGDHVAVDVETGTIAQCKEWLPEFDKQLRSVSGTHPWLYTFLSFYQQGLSIGSRRYWISAWGDNEPSVRHGDTLELWQDTDGAVGPEPHSAAGIPGNCDMSIVTNREQLKAWRRDA